MAKPVGETVHRIIVDHFLYGDTSKPLGVDDSFLDMGIIDSTGVLMLVGYLEEEFGIEVEDQEIVPENFDSVAKLTRYIQQKQSNVTHAG